MEQDSEKKKEVCLQIRCGGKIYKVKIELYAEILPVTCDWFESLCAPPEPSCKNKESDKCYVSRVVKPFFAVIENPGREDTFQEKPKGKLERPLHKEKGQLSMLRAKVKKEESKGKVKKEESKGKVKKEESKGKVKKEESKAKVKKKGSKAKVKKKGSKAKVKKKGSKAKVKKKGSKAKVKKKGSKGKVRKRGSKGKVKKEGWRKREPLYGTSFLMTFKDCPYLDTTHVPFGKVTQGLDELMKAMDSLRLHPSGAPKGEKEGTRVRTGKEDGDGGSGGKVASSSALSTKGESSTRKVGGKKRQREETGITKGLKNIGNTCYLNAVTIVLLHMAGFCRDVMAVNVQGFLPTQSVCVALQNLLRKKEQEGIGLNPMALKECIARFASQFQGNFEQDAHEVYGILLGLVEYEYLQSKLAMKCKQEADKRALNFTESLQETGCPSSRAFMGSVENVFTCSVCKNKSSKIETFKDISLALGESDGGKMSHSLQSLVEQHFATEVIPKDCEKCGSHSAEVIHKLRRLPSIFVVHLKRLTAVPKPNANVVFEKSAVGVDVPPTLDLRQFCDQRTCMPVQCNVEESSNLETPVTGREETVGESSAARGKAHGPVRKSTTPAKFLRLCEDTSHIENRPAGKISGDIIELMEVEMAKKASLRDSSSAKAKDQKTPQKQITLVSPETTNLAPNTPEEFPASCLSSLQVVDNLNCQTFASMASSNIEYSLSAVISHEGGPTSGHYISHLQRENTGQWLCYDDEVVTKSDWRDLQNLSRNCYMLFYSHKLQAA